MKTHRRHGRSCLEPGNPLARPADTDSRLVRGGERPSAPLIHRLSTILPLPHEDARPAACLPVLARKTGQIRPLEPFHRPETELQHISRKCLVLPITGPHYEV